jgi:hypothetical protein
MVVGGPSAAAVCFPFLGRCVLVPNVFYAKSGLKQDALDEGEFGVKARSERWSGVILLIRFSNMFTILLAELFTDRC